MEVEETYFICYGKIPIIANRKKWNEMNKRLKYHVYCVQNSFKAGCSSIRLLCSGDFLCDVRIIPNGAFFYLYHSILIFGLSVGLSLIPSVGT